MPKKHMTEINYLSTANLAKTAAITMPSKKLFLDFNFFRDFKNFLSKGSKYSDPKTANHSNLSIIISKFFYAFVLNFTDRLNLA